MFKIVIHTESKIVIHTKVWEKLKVAETLETQAKNVQSRMKHRVV